MANTHFSGQRRLSRRWLWMMLAFLVVGLMGASGAPTTASAGHHWEPFSFMTDPTYTFWERVALILNVIVALAGLGYA